MAMPKTSAPSDSELGVRKIHTHIKIGCYNIDLELYQTDTLLTYFFKCIASYEALAFIAFK